MQLVPLKQLKYRTGIATIDLKKAAKHFDASWLIVVKTKCLVRFKPSWSHRNRIYSDEHIL